MPTTATSARRSPAMTFAQTAQEASWMPLQLFTGWWGAALNLWCPPHGLHGAGAEHHDLELPPELEDAAEQALFA